MVECDLNLNLLGCPVKEISPSTPQLCWVGLKL